MRSTCSNTSFEVRAILLGQGKRKRHFAGVGKRKNHFAGVGKRKSHFAWDGNRKSDFCVAQPVKVITG